MAFRLLVDIGQSTVQFRQRYRRRRHRSTARRVQNAANVVVAWRSGRRDNGRGPAAAVRRRRSVLRLGYRRVVETQ